MDQLSERLYAQARIIPVREPRRVRTIKKLESGALEVTPSSGDVFTIAPEDEDFQAFLVWMVLNDDA